MRLITSRITLLKAEGPYRTCNESKEEKRESPHLQSQSGRTGSSLKSRLRTLEISLVPEMSSQNLLRPRQWFSSLESSKYRGRKRTSPTGIPLALRASVQMQFREFQGWDLLSQTRHSFTTASKPLLTWSDGLFFEFRAISPHR